MLNTMISSFVAFDEARNWMNFGFIIGLGDIL
jgi:hypothetical protein